METVRDRLTEAIGAGELVSIRYHGGSDPGAVREILPLAFEGPENVRARCYTSNAVKIFRLAKIEVMPRPVDASSPDLWSRSAVLQDVPVPAVAAEICSEHHAAWRALGWSVAPVDIDVDSFALCLHRPKKRGGGFLKSPSVELSFERWDVHYVARPDGGTDIVVGDARVKPWTLRVEGGKTRSWRSYPKASAALVETANRGP